MSNIGLHKMLQFKGAHINLYHNSISGKKEGFLIAVHILSYAPELVASLERLYYA